VPYLLKNKVLATVSKNTNIKPLKKACSEIQKKGLDSSVLILKSFSTLSNILFLVKNAGENVIVQFIFFNIYYTVLILKKQVKFEKSKAQ